MNKLVKIFMTILIFVLVLGCLSLGIASNIKVNQEEVIIESAEEGVDPVIEYRDHYVGDYVVGFLKLGGVRDNLGKDLFSSIFSITSGFLIGLELGIILISFYKKKKTISKNKFRDKSHSDLKEKIPEPMEQKQIRF